jgi:hypothetical protein
MHGPLVPLGCDTLMEWGGDILIAEKLKCLVAPPIFYMHPAASGPWPGTVNVPPEASAAYLREVVPALVRGGFKRVILSGSHGPLSGVFSMLKDSVLRESTLPLLSIAAHSILLPHDLVTKAFGGRFVGEDMLVAACMRVLGWGDAYDPFTRTSRPREFPSSTIGALKKITGNSGCVPWVFFRDYQHTGIQPGTTRADIDRLFVIMQQALERIDDLPGLYAQYQKEVSALHRRKPWAKQSVWSV